MFSEPNRRIKHLQIRLLYTWRRWSRRGTFVMGGLAVGAAAVLMAWLADNAQELFAQMHRAHPWLALAATPLGFGLAVWLARRYFPNSQGSGIPQVIAAFPMGHQATREKLVSMRVAVGKIFVMCVGLMFGASTGREGPTVQVGAAILHAIGRHSPLRQSGFLLAGGAAGVAAAFNTPLAGIVFGIEELSRSFEAKTSGLIIGAIVAAGLTSFAVFGDYAYFGESWASLPLGSGWLALLAGAVLGGFTGGLFIRCVNVFMPGRRGWLGALGDATRRRPVAFAMLCGLGVALCGLNGDLSVFGTGYAQARLVVHGGDGADVWFGPLKFMATTFSAMSGIPGGVFSPSLAIGAGEASALHLLFPHLALSALALVCMVAYLTGVTHAPITAFVIVAEMTNDHAMVVPLMLAALIANFVSRQLNPEGFYHTLARNFLRKPDDSAARAH
jgi:H+/Cl- antiporter ClcA